MPNKEKEMINTNKAVLVSFPAYTNPMQLNNTATANIYIPFPVKQINVKGIDLDFDADFRVVYFTSNLVDNGPLGSGFGGILCDYSASSKNISYIFPTPRDINSTYSFTYNVIDVQSFYFTRGYIADGTNFNATTNALGTAFDGTAAGVIPPDASGGAPPARVLFILEFIGYV